MKRTLMIGLLVLVLVLLIGQTAHAQAPIVPPPPPIPTIDPIDQANRDAVNADAQAAQLSANASAANASAQAAIAQANAANTAAEQARQAAAAARAYAQQQQTQAAVNAANEATLKATEADRGAQEARAMAEQASANVAQVKAEIATQSAQRKVSETRMMSYARGLEGELSAEQIARRSAEQDAATLRRDGDAQHAMLLTLAAFAVALAGLCLMLARKTAMVQIVEERTTLLSGQRRMPVQGETFDDSQTVEKFDRLWEAA
jgi:hypothetical protein